MGKLLWSIVAAALAGLFIAAAPTSPPKFNIAPGCKAAAAINQAMDLSVGQNYQTCIEDEEAARQQLVQNWSGFTPQDRTRCIGQTQINGMPSYVEVLACLQVTAKSTAQPTGKKGTADAKTDAKRIGTTVEKTIDLSSTVEALRADAANSAKRIAELEEENAELKETLGTLKTSLAVFTETITQLQEKNSNADRALKKAEQERVSAENRLHDLEHASSARKSGEDDAGRYSKDIAYLACGGLIALVILSASYFWARRKRVKRPARPAVKSELQPYALKAGGNMGAIDTTIKPGQQPKQDRPRAALERISE
jgi:hypothetical protein